MAFVERRRYPRVAGPLPNDVLITVPIPTRVVDISRSGALMAGTRRLEAGLKGRFRASMGGMPVSASVEIRHRSPHRHPDGMYRFGASFTSLSDASTETLALFLEQRGRKQA